MMPVQTTRCRVALCATAVLLSLAAASCVSTFFTTATSTSRTITFRVENASANAVDVLVEILNEQGEPLETTVQSQAVDIPVITVTRQDVSYSTLTPIGAAAGQISGGLDGGDAAGSQAAVRVSGFTLSEGLIRCGPMLRISAFAGSGATRVILAGAGSGVPGFDEGSVGPDGERYLLRGLDFDCGEAIVIRIDAEAEADVAAKGQLAVVQTGQPSPFDPVGQPGGNDEEDGENVSAPDDVTVRIDNRTTLIAAVALEVTGSDGVRTYDVNVPPNVMTEGDFTCGTQLALSATFPNTGRAPGDIAEGALADAAIILTGQGTGAPGFDEASVAPDGQRILTVGRHVNCGEVVVLTILDDSAVATPNGFNAAAVGAGHVQVLGNGEDSGDSGIVDEGARDMIVLLENQTSEFVRLNVASGAGGLGQQLDVYVPPGRLSTGALSCADRFTITAHAMSTEALNGLLEEILIVLEGAGTGTAGFDSGSVGAMGQRLLLLDAHYACGDSLIITVTDPGRAGYTELDILDEEGEVVGFEDVNSNGVQDEVPDRLGEGRVEVQRTADTGE